MTKNCIDYGLVGLIESMRIVLPLKAVQYAISVAGGLAEVTVTQVFFQQNPRCLDCVYQFPLPADGSVYACEAFINDRVIRARVGEREAARELAQRKKVEGCRTVLVESERPNMFTLSLGNLQPDDLIEIRLAYIQPLRRLADRFALEIPSCPGLRYIPGRLLLRSNRGRGIADDTDQVPDASRISPVRIDSFHPDAAFMAIEGRIDAATVDLPSVISPSHRIATIAGERWVSVQLADHGAVPDRDFVLRWSELPADAPVRRAWVHAEEDISYALIEIRAPKSAAENREVPQDIYFLVDRSGSMAGEKWVNAVTALQNFVAVLSPEDRIMVTLFQSDFHDFAEMPLVPSALQRDANFQNLARLGTEGGTELAPALRHVIELIGRHSQGRRASLILITDAQVGNESGILQLLKQAPAVPVHCFGIDNVLNDGLLVALTRQQGGTFQSLNPNEDIGTAVTVLGRSLRQPVLLDLELSPGWEPADHRLPNLYAGQVHYACARGTAKSPLALKATDPAGHPVQMRFRTLESANAGPYFHWHKTRIQRLLAEDSRSAAAIELSKAANLICELTAFVAWDGEEKVAVATHELVQPSLAELALSDRVQPRASKVPWIPFVVMASRKGPSRQVAPEQLGEMAVTSPALSAAAPPTGRGEGSTPGAARQATRSSVESEETRFAGRFAALQARIPAVDLGDDLKAILRWAFSQDAGTETGQRLAILKELARTLEEMATNLESVITEIEAFETSIAASLTQAQAAVRQARVGFKKLAKRMTAKDVRSGDVDELLTDLPRDLRPLLQALHGQLLRRENLKARRTEFESLIVGAVSRCQQQVGVSAGVSS